MCHPEVVKMFYSTFARRRNQQCSRVYRFLLRAHATFKSFLACHTCKDEKNLPVFIATCYNQIQLKFYMYTFVRFVFVARAYGTS